ncbi:MAG TPA: xanthine dehydrogenase family protein molybdopterin-binding subunit [Candidatus Methylomirabilis sp.]|jgi:2-furoyl-CoA dehydrogenase large subunit
MAATAKWVGQDVRRQEDVHLLCGRGLFMEDLGLPNLHHAAILRSPHPHARLRRVDASEALKARGVAAVLTGQDVAAHTTPFRVVVKTPARYYCMAVDKVRYVGEPVALVVARDRYQAEDALDLIRVEYEPLPAVVDPEGATEPGAPLLHEAHGSNVAVQRRLRWGDVEAAFREADVVVGETYRFPKYNSMPLETYGVVAGYDGPTGLLTLWSNFMGPFVMHPIVARALGLPENHLRFIVPTDIGGSFGIKTSIYPYLTLLGLAAMRSGVPVKWIEDRREHLMASSSGTDRVSHREMALRKDGTILGIRVRLYDNVGAYLRSPEPACTYARISSFPAGYHVRNIAIDAYNVTTNKCPTGPNRGYGCQQNYFEQERLLDLAAEKLGMDPAALRQKNLIPAGSFPYTTATGGVYDSGDYPETFRRVLELAGYARLREEQRRLRAQGRYIGIGIATGVEGSVSNMGYITLAIDPTERAKPEYLPKSGAFETATLNMDPSGSITVVMSSTPQGQGHQTTVAQIVADELGVRPDQVTVTDEMDTFVRKWSISSGTYSSRFSSVGTSAAALAARKMRGCLAQIAGNMLGVAPDQLDFRDGQAVVRGVPEKATPLRRIAGTAHWNPSLLPEGMEPGLQVTATFSFPLAAPPDPQDRVNSQNVYSYLADVALVEVDPETAQVTILRYATVHDPGKVINPMLVEGQTHGGALMGVAGALYEELAYDQQGQLLTSTLMDYLCPSAAEAPPMVTGFLESPSPFTLLGSKGVGESSSMTAPAAIANAVADALAPLGVRVAELPLSPTKLFRLIQEARARMG